MEETTLVTNEKTLLVRIRMKGVTASSRTDWDHDAVRKITEVIHNGSAWLPSTGWSMSLETVEILPEKT
jgi:hypothetical protein